MTPAVVWINSARSTARNKSGRQIVETALVNLSPTKRITDRIRRIYKRASQRGALFVWAIFFAWVTAVTPGHVEARIACPTDRIDSRASVQQVIDGDTLRLVDGRLVRFIGINTPEIGRRGKPSEPMAEQARKMLQSMLGDKATVGLRYGRELRDRYKRVLAHVYLADGSSVEAQLLEAGLAAQIIVPPNVWNQACYQSAERAARVAGKGVWAEYYRPVPVADLPKAARGFRVITGTVSRVGESKRSLWLNFPRRLGEGRREGVAVRISRDDLDYFDTWRPKDLQGKTIIVRGWIYPYKKQQMMRLRRPGSLTIVQPVAE